jgi:hypothetical protein
MAAHKYDKYFLRDSPWRQFKLITGPIIQRLDGKTIQGSNFYFIQAARRQRVEGIGIIL